MEQKLDLILNELRTVNTRLERVENKVDGLENKVDRLEVKVNSLEVGQREIKVQAASNHMEALCEAGKVHAEMSAEIKALERRVPAV